MGGWGWEIIQRKAAVKSAHPKSSTFADFVAVVVVEVLLWGWMHFTAAFHWIISRPRPPSFKLCFKSTGERCLKLEDKKV